LSQRLYTILKFLVIKKLQVICSPAGRYAVMDIAKEGPEENFRGGRTKNKSQKYLKYLIKML